MENIMTMDRRDTHFWIARQIYTTAIHRNKMLSAQCTPVKHGSIKVDNMQFVGRNNLIPTTHKSVQELACFLCHRILCMFSGSSRVLQVFRFFKSLMSVTMQIVHYTSHHGSTFISLSFGVAPKVCAWTGSTPLGASSVFV